MLRGELEEHAVVVRWSRFKSTVMKLSAIPGKEVYPHRDIAPVIKELTEAYGPARQIYGGGFGSGATGESYRQARERAAGYLSFLATGDRAKVLGGTAARLFQLVR